MFSTTLIVRCKKLKIVYFVFSAMKKIFLFFVPCSFPVKLIHFIAFGSASSTCCLLESIDSHYNCFEMFET